MRIAESFEVRIMTALTKNEAESMRLEKLGSVEEIQQIIDEKPNGYILPFGAKFHCK